MITLYNVTSEDGFISTKEGSERFIPDYVWEDFLELLDKYDVLVFGINTYNSLQWYTKKLRIPFEKLPIRKIVLTRDVDFVPIKGYKVIHSLDDISTLIGNILVTGGPNLNTPLLKTGLVHKIIINKVQATIGEGIPQFNDGVSPKKIEEYTVNKRFRDITFYKLVH